MAGIVDCASACHGPTAVDMAHTRCNLMIDGSEAAEGFLLEYQNRHELRHTCFPRLCEAGMAIKATHEHHELATSIATNLRMDAPIPRRRTDGVRSRPVRDGHTLQAQSADRDYETVTVTVK